MAETEGSGRNRDSRELADENTSVRNDKNLSSARPGARGPRLFSLVATFAAIYVIWGSTYLGIKFAIETIPPLLMAGTRFLTAGVALYLLARLRGGKGSLRVRDSSLVHWRSAVAIGALLFLFGNGGVTLAESKIASSLAALLIATEPLWIVLINWVRPHGERPTGKTLLGLLVGFVGVWLLISPGRVVVDPFGFSMVMVAAVAWAAGSLYSIRAPLPRSPLLAAGMQMIAGGALLILAGLLTGELSLLHWGNISVRSILALVYLILFGSIIAFTAYSWLLHNVSAARVSTYAYVNPAVACFLGWALGGEAMTTRTWVAAAVIVVSVILITSHRRRSEAKSAGGVGETAIPESPLESGACRSVQVEPVR